MALITFDFVCLSFAIHLVYFYHKHMAILNSFIFLFFFSFLQKNHDAKSLMSKSQTVSFRGPFYWMQYQYQCYWLYIVWLLHDSNSKFSLMLLSGRKSERKLFLRAKEREGGRSNDMKTEEGEGELWKAWGGIMRKIERAGG